MPMTVKVGLAKKMGQPDFGSLGASCDIELELDGSLLFHDLDGLQKKIQSAYVACRQAVNDELARQSQSPDLDKRETATSSCVTHVRDRSAAERRSQDGVQQTSRIQNERPTNGHRRKATASQVRALHAIATRQGVNLAGRLEAEFQLDHAEDLSITQASQLIDALKSSAAEVRSSSKGGKI